MTALVGWEFQPIFFSFLPKWRPFIPFSTIKQEMPCGRKGCFYWQWPISALSATFATYCSGWLNTNKSLWRILLFEVESNEITWRHRRSSNQKSSEGYVSITDHFPATHLSIFLPCTSLQPAAFEKDVAGWNIEKPHTLFAITLISLYKQPFRPFPSVTLQSTYISLGPFTSLNNGPNNWIITLSHLKK